ncbi:uncharacterized protein MONOS_1018 [Monocercomonoides exilis]|uniref:uncharacterized protein n=1 Tax=Monocercomonoides exilis TaxID=2049356 RepID=UPI0035595D03|nr:hypothetical protein MONOS_1018 [Monocercomonoides exilis]|eukprot:MONOS_1018.1-p1 / transcript=MONOS_1018.1 / gene=MONOS_1018 / organism=Monocercomonoides_exilis_PA203 / gene_product=unspecified product / transcript_product=unspecified product / location=Mono_scaffold00017:61511-63580(-) / protein_length=607 / sequence_SO=supercontig / SO=protein_coding / is_pseudo=false
MNVVDKFESESLSHFDINDFRHLNGKGFLKTSSVTNENALWNKPSTALSCSTTFVENSIFGSKTLTDVSSVPFAIRNELREENPRAQEEDHTQDSHTKTFTDISSIRKLHCKETALEESSTHSTYLHSNFSTIQRNDHQKITHSDPTVANDAKSLYALPENQIMDAVDTQIEMAIKVPDKAVELKIPLEKKAIINSLKTSMIKQWERYDMDLLKKTGMSGIPTSMTLLPRERKVIKKEIKAARKFAKLFGEWVQKDWIQNEEEQLMWNAAMVKMDCLDKVHEPEKANESLLVITVEELKCMLSGDGDENMSVMEKEEIREMIEKAEKRFEKEDRLKQLTDEEKYEETLKEKEAIQLKLKEETEEKKKEREKEMNDDKISEIYNENGNSFEHVSFESSANCDEWMNTHNLSSTPVKEQHNYQFQSSIFSFDYPFQFSHPAPLTASVLMKAESEDSKDSLHERIHYSNAIPELFSGDQLSSNNTQRLRLSNQTKHNLLLIPQSKKQGTSLEAAKNRDFSLLNTLTTLPSYFESSKILSSSSVNASNQKTLILPDGRNALSLFQYPFSEDDCLLSNNHCYQLLLNTKTDIQLMCDEKEEINDFEEKEGH